MNAEETLTQISCIVKEAVLWLDLATPGSVEHGEITRMYMDRITEQLCLYSGSDTSADDASQCTIDPVTGGIKRP